MKTMRSSILCFVVLLLTAPLLRAQDLSKYRHFALGMSITKVLEHIDQKIADIKVIHQKPAVIQEVTWWPPNIPGRSFQADPVQQILFSFYNGELYRMSITYDRDSIEGLTTEDIVQSISARYGAPAKLTTEINVEPQYSKDQIVAHWEDSQYSADLHRPFLNGFELVIYSSRRNAEADEAIAKAVKLEEQEGPQREVERQKKEADDLETARQKNRKIFRP